MTEQEQNVLQAAESLRAEIAEFHGICCSDVEISAVRLYQQDGQRAWQYALAKSTLKKVLQKSEEGSMQYTVHVPTWHNLSRPVALRLSYPFRVDVNHDCDGGKGLFRSRKIRSECPKKELTNQILKRFGKWIGLNDEQSKRWRLPFGMDKGEVNNMSEELAINCCSSTSAEKFDIAYWNANDEKLDFWLCRLVSGQPFLEALRDWTESENRSNVQRVKGNDVKTEPRKKYLAHCYRDSWGYQGHAFSETNLSSENKLGRELARPLYPNDKLVWYINSARCSCSECDGKIEAGSVNPDGYCSVTGKKGRIKMSLSEKGTPTFDEAVMLASESTVARAYRCPNCSEFVFRPELFWRCETSGRATPFELPTITLDPCQLQQTLIRAAPRTQEAICAGPVSYTHLTLPTKA